MLKKCTKCNQKKDITEFHKSKKERDGHCYWCKECAKIHQQTLKIKAKKYDLKCRFGISLEEYNDLLKKQNEVCAICYQKETRVRYGNVVSLSVDHDHITGKTRGLLCHKCNTAIGLLRENVTILERATEYIRIY